MEKQESKSKWDELAREIGAEIPPETIAREEAVATPQPPPAVRPVRSVEKSAESRALPKKAAPGWDSLAGELGLPPLPPEETPAVPPKPQRPAAREEVRPEPPRRQEERADEPPRREPPRREGSQGRRPERPPREEREQRGDREPRGERGGRGRRGGRSEGRGRSERPRDENRDQRDRQDRPDHRRPPRDFDAESEADREVRPAPEEIEETRSEQRTESPAPVREEPPKPAAVSLWHKIFGSPAEQSAKLVDEEPLPDASEALGIDRDEPRSAGSGFADPHADEHAEAERVHEFEDEDRPAGMVGDDDESDRKGGRPRRRRGRGRGRRTEGEQAEGRSIEPRESRGPRRDRDVARPRPERTECAERNDEFDDLSVDDELGALGDDIDDGDEVPVGEGAAEGRSALARAIPSWDEAIGFIVDTNMSSRSQRRPPSRSGPRDNGGARGRGRGRRKS